MQTNHADYAEYAPTLADSDQYKRCGKCTQLFEHQEFEDGLCGWCAQAAREDLAAGAELEPSIRYAGRS